MKMYSANGFKRVAKKTAERRYNSGETIYLCAHNLRPGGPWHPEAAVSKSNIDDCGYQRFVASDDEFESVVSQFAYYNCNTCAGRYPAYYIREDEKA